MEILRDSLWQFFGALFTFIAITVSIIIYLFQRQKKKLNYSIFRLPLLSFQKVVPENLDIKITLDNNKIIIYPLLLNPKDSFTIRAITTGEKEKVQLDYRIIGINKIVEGSSRSDGFGLGMFGFALIWSSVTMIVADGISQVKSSDLSLNTISIILFSLGMLLIIIPVSPMLIRGISSLIKVIFHNNKV